MNMNKYQELSLRTYPKDKTFEQNLSNFALGIVSEGGEVGDHVKKRLHHGHELNRKEVVEELGDVMFYISSMATLLDVDLETIAVMNVKKLRKRYENGFSEEASRNRVE